MDNGHEGEGNARRGGGPRTQTGKRRSSQNARKFGLTSQVVELPGENRAAGRRRSRKLRAFFRPNGAHAEILFERYLAGATRLDRNDRIVQSLLSTEVAHRRVLRVQSEAAHRLLAPELSVDQAAGAVGSGEVRESFRQALVRASEIAEVRDGEGSDLGVAFSNVSDELDRLHRYRVSDERMLMRLAFELERLRDEHDGGSGD